MSADPERPQAFIRLRTLGIDGPVVSDLIGEFGDLDGVFTASGAELRQLDGVGSKTVEKIKEGALDAAIREEIDFEEVGR